MSARTGLGQHQRMPAGLTPHYFDVDELTLPQLLTLSLDYADMVRFAETGTDLADAGTWRPYFAPDETLVMADILATRLDGERASFDGLLERALAGGQPVAHEQLPSFVLYSLGKKLDHWSEVLLRNGSPVGIDLGALLAAARGQMAPQLRTLHDWFDKIDVNAPIDFAAHMAGLCEVLGLKAGESDELARISMKTWFNQLIKGIEIAQRGAAVRLEQSLRSGMHDPGVGMLLAFVQLYRQAQDKLNRLTERHLDFYYDQVLLMRPHGPVHDTTFLVFQASIPGASVTIPADTAFLAQFDRLQPELTFASAHTLVVSDARLCASHTLFCERNPLTSPESSLFEMRHGAKRPYPTAYRLNTFAALEPEATLDTVKLLPQPLFGAPRADVARIAGRSARLGFALASNVLLMQEGERQVHVALELGADATVNGDGDDGTLAQRLRRLAPLLRVSDAEVRYKVFRRMFTLSVSGAAGWLSITEYSAEFTPGAGAVLDTLHLYFSIGAERAAVVPFNPAMHEGGYDISVPLLRCEFNAVGYLYPYGLLRGLPLITAQIDVNVIGHRSVALQNHIGQLSTSAPFLPFGPLPAPGAYLIVGSAEIACKRLTNVDLVLNWGGLPSAAGGFRAYYDAYDTERPFEDVQCELSVLVNGRWHPLDTPQRPLHTLFSPQLATRSNAIATTETVNLNPLLHLTRPLARHDEQSDFSYTPNTKGGFFKLALAGPEFAFGHRNYPFALAAALTYNSQVGKWRRVRQLPKPPYAPLLDALSLNYRARATIWPTPGAAGEALLRLHPLGWEYAQGGVDGGDLLLPQIDYAGSLYLGLKASDMSAPLTLFFHLVENALPMAELDARKLHWFYLSDNKWLPLPTDAIRADSTRAFLRPGIVTLKLPANINRNNTVMSPDLYWLRVSCETDLEKFCSLYSVHPHAAQVWRRIDQAAPAGAPAVIAAATIRRPRSAIAGLGRITQMIDSFGGRLTEDRIQLRRRSAERLKHKGRAITADDYERLILEQFPEIDRVKCFPNLSLSLSGDGGVCPGHVLIVGLPPFAAHGQLELLPHLNGELIGKVNAFIESRASAAVKIEVVNPLYERIQVRCKVVLATGADAGWYLNRLDELVSDFISPWSSSGNTSHFGWCIRQHDLESLILAQDGVLGVSEFSMLSVSDQHGVRYALADTAVRGPAGRAVPDMTPSFPWCVAVPFKRHMILVAGNELSVAASRTGIGKLEIGSTFIISTGAVDAEKK